MSSHEVSSGDRIEDSPAMSDEKDVNNFAAQGQLSQALQSSQVERKTGSAG
jgi:hypothetical protein